MDTNYLKYGKKYPFLLRDVKNSIPNRILSSCSPPNLVGEASNISNIYDFVGLAHNQICAEYESQINQIGNSEDGLIELIDKYLNRTFYLDQFKSYVYPNKLAPFIAKLREVNKNYDVGSEEWSRRLGAFPDDDTPVGQYFAQMRLILRNLRFKTNVTKYVDEIKKIEHSIMTSKLSDEEKRGVLMCSSVFRHSIVFWSWFGMDSSSFIHIDEIEHSTELPDWVGADLAGASGAIRISAATWGGLVGGAPGYAGAIIGIGAACSIISTW